MACSGASSEGGSSSSSSGNDPGAGASSGQDGGNGGIGGGSSTNNPGGGGSTNTPGTGGDTNPDPGSTDPGSGTTDRWRPAPGTSWQIQYTGTFDPSVDVQVFDIDLFDISAQTITDLHAKGKKVICYFSAGSYENWRPDQAQFPAAALGKNLDGWPGEKWLDIRDTKVRTIMKARLDLAKQHRCDAVDPDNVDGYRQNSNFNLTAADQLSYNRFLATEAHARGMSILLKNDLDQIGDLIADFDGAVNEQCMEYDECDTLTPFISANKAVFHIEYGSSSKVNAVCPPSNALNFDTLIKNLDLDATRISCR
ncbi:endo alpha-1,4 polygalactosaminidase precursor [Labilithrix luteola]|uniref:Endo alpha-1,4 polygalactosaminidase n=2 Tax=Labilithrix luteola TaxID=1391654 RepID=A0A0K1PT62_9BACT|nr:endo alpha-1,4 polygalactosaminidase precursor [Labilithrix luteola]